MMIGYARVSTTEQETTLQHDALMRAGVVQIFQEKASAVSSRPQLFKALSSMHEGDVLVVWKLDRLARSLQDLLLLLGKLDAKKCGIRSLSEPIDTETPAGRLMIHMLGAVAQFERSLIRERCMAGQRAAMARGVVCGRKRSISLEVEADIVQLHATGDYTLSMLSMVFEVHPSTVKRAVYRVKKPGHSSLL
jgi:DNA invertase Pin-like site-specific DNA recombinase